MVGQEMDMLQGEIMKEKCSCKCSKNSIMAVDNEYGRYSVATTCSDLTADEFVSNLVRPIMLAVGYAEHTIDGVLNDIR